MSYVVVLDSAKMGGTGLSLQVRTKPAETLEADIQAALKLDFTLHCGGPV